MTMIYINRKYPFVVLKIKSILLISIVLLLIMYILQPFGFDNYAGNKLLVSLGFGVITFASVCFFNYVVKRIIPRYIKKWTLFLEFIYTVVLICFITLINYFYLSMLFRIPLNFMMLLYAMYYTTILGLIPSAFLILFKYYKFLNTQLSALVDSPKEVESIIINISTNSTREKNLQIKLNDFLYAEAEKNNIQIYYYQDGKVISKVIRSTLAILAEELKYPNIFRCHRSFIVNLNHIESAKGNSNGYQISLKGYNKTIQVSRKYVKELKSFIY